MQCYNALEHAVVYVIVIIRMVTAAGGKNCSQEILKSNLSCPSSERWNLLIPPYVYVAKNYNPTIYPNEVIYDAATIVFQNIKILEVDEKKKEVTLELLIFMIWKDARIEVIHPNKDYYIAFPPITNENDKPMVWNPHNKFSIVNLRNRKYLKSPIIMDIALLGIIKVNKLFTSDNFLKNTSSAFFVSQMEWELTIRCPFNFSQFPFDENVCPVAMRFTNVNVKFADQEFMYFEDPIPMIADGFIINITNSAPTIQKHPKLEIYWTDIGFQISLKHQVRKYIYQYYLPCFAIVMTSSFSFIIPLSAIPGRVSLIVTLFLTLTNIFIVQMVRNIIHFYK